MIVSLAIRDYSKRNVTFELGSGHFPDTTSAGDLMLNFPAFKTINNKFLLFVNHPVYSILSQQPNQTEKPTLVRAIQCYPALAHSFQQKASGKFCENFYPGTHRGVEHQWGYVKTWVPMNYYSGSNVGSTIHQLPGLQQVT